MSKERKDLILQHIQGAQTEGELDIANSAMQQYLSEEEFFEAHPAITWIDVNCFRCEGDSSRELNRVGKFAVRQCATCDQVFTTPRPSDEDLVRFYQNDYGGPEIDRPALFPELKARAFDRQQSMWAEGRLGLIDQYTDLVLDPLEPYTFRFFGDNEPDLPEMLEIGVPLGRYFISFAVQHGYSVTSHQFSEDLARSIALPGSRQTYHGPIETAGMPEDFFDVVCAWDIIEHVSNPRVFLDTIHALLKKGGAVALSCPNFDSIPQRLLKSRWPTLKPGEHIWQFTPSTIERALGDAGMEVRTIVNNPLHSANLGRFDSMVAIAQKSLAA